MANETIYPYGTNGQLPISIGIVNDLTTGGAYKALSTEQGKVLNENYESELFDAFHFKTSVGYYINASGVLKTGTAQSVASGFLKVSEGDVVVFTGGQNEFSQFPVVWGYAGTDESSPTSLKSYGVYDGTEITIPNGVNYVRAWSMITYTNMSLIIKGSISETLKDTIAMENDVDVMKLKTTYDFAEASLSGYTTNIDFDVQAIVGLKLSLKLVYGTLGWTAYLMKDNDNATAREVSPVDGIATTTYTSDDATVGRNKMRFHRTSDSDTVGVLMTRYPFFAESDTVVDDDLTRYLSLDSQKYDICYPYYSVKSGTASAGARLDFTVPKLIGTKFSLMLLDGSVSSWVAYLMKDNDNATARTIHPNELGGAFIEYTSDDATVGRNKARFYVSAGSGAYTTMLTITPKDVDTEFSRNIPKNKLTLYDDQKDVTTALFVTDNFTTSGTSLLSASGDNFVYYNKRFIGDQRKAKFFVTTPSTLGGKIRVGALNNSDLSSIKYSSCCEIDITNSTMCIYKGGGSNGVDTVSVKLKEAQINQTISASTDYIIELERNRKITTLRLINYLTLETDEITFDGNRTSFTNGAGNQRPYYFIYTNTSGVKFNRLSIMGAYDVALAHVGDSLSESNGRADTTGTGGIGVNWIEQIMNGNNWDGSIVAQSNMYVADAITALNNEIAFMKPRILSIMIGTNSGITSSQIETIKSFCSERNIILLMHHVPIIGTNPTSSANINAAIDAANVRGARMDVACALNGVVADGIDPSCYSSDEVHTNQKGNNRMADMARTDCPEMVWFNRDPMAI